MNRPQPTRSDHDRCCKLEGWERDRDARGRTGPLDRTDYGVGMWRHILRDQSQVDDETFWACVRDGVLPSRGIPTPPRESVPLGVVHLLLTRVGLSPDEVAVMDKAQAVERLSRFWVDGA